MTKDARQENELSAIRRARILGMTYFDTSAMPSKTLYPDILSTAEIKQDRAVPVSADKFHVKFGITTTTPHSAIQSLRQRFLDQQLEFVLISDDGFSEYVALYDPPKEVHYEDIDITHAETHDVNIKAISASLDEVRPDDVLGYLVKQAHNLKASDIHMETGAESTRIRFRVDGVLHPIAQIARERYSHLLSSVASAANISSNSSVAQVGHIKSDFTLADKSTVSVNLRIETVPTIYGMDVVMRLFNFKSDFLRLDNLGLTDAQKAVMDDIIRHPNGLVLIVGPTGSGKTTTLYSLINELNSPERKIITLEDPVEYYIEGITQIPVNAGGNAASKENTFGERLKAVLRLDPDVIMVGEIRDAETAKTALQASLTGHLVLSTFHAGSAAAALTRMVDVIGDNPLFASSIRLVAAQRLIRRLDDNTKQPYQPDEHLRQEIEQVIRSLPHGVEWPNLEHMTLYKPGKSEQNPFGYTGQFAIREQLVMTPALQSVLRRPPHEITTELLEQTAVSSGMTTMLQDGVIKALAGDTSIEEVYRVVG